MVKSESVCGLSSMKGRQWRLLTTIMRCFIGKVDPWAAPELVNVWFNPVFMIPTCKSLERKFPFFLRFSCIFKCELFYGRVQ